MLGFHLHGPSSLVGRLLGAAILAWALLPWPPSVATPARPLRLAPSVAERASSALVWWLGARAAGPGLALRLGALCGDAGLTASQLGAALLGLLGALRGDVGLPGDPPWRFLFPSSSAVVVCLFPRWRGGQRVFSRALPRGARAYLFGERCPLPAFAGLAFPSPREFGIAGLAAPSPSSHDAAGAALSP